jgi:hypothetical protein
MGKKPILTVLKAEGHSADTGAGKFPLVSMGARAEGLACADPGARTPIGASGNFQIHIKINGWRQNKIRQDQKLGRNRCNKSKCFSVQLDISII